ncbi:uncharacterized protein LOC122506870 isoform X2 [Leptopilina heterotoma]|uniref:uncharacterized protein LOC122506870 isoform X2 n=1 Tax=Leptopilina heterotoma TaxID=63436 RepID=UPI001CA9719D|nr:uncharacterized protein LOC122506870 isoform X2 [Leptopilina heterotoma]
MAYLPNSRIEEVKATIRSCLVTHKGPITIKQLNNQYHFFEEEVIPYKEFRFKTLLDFLSSLKDVLRIIDRNGESYVRVIDTENTRPISSLVANQKPSKQKKSKRMSSGHYGNTRESHHRDNREDHSRMKSRSEEQKYISFTNSSNSSNDDSDRYNKPKDDELQRSNYVKPKQDKNTYRTESDTKYQKSNQVTTTKNSVNDNSIINDDSNRDYSSILINSRIVGRLRELIEKHPDGIWCAELPTIYFDTYTSTLNYVDLGFESVREFASSLSNVFHCVQVFEGGDHKLYNAKNALPAFYGLKRQIEIDSNNQNTINNNGEKAIPQKLEPKTMKHFIPENVMSVTESVGQIMVKDLCQDKDYEEVVLCELFTPNYLFCHLRKNLKIFKDFMYNLHYFYEENKTKYQIPPIALKPGLNVVCLFDKKWHRAIVKMIRPEERVVVHFYDYGTVKTYGVHEMCFLHKKFSQLPAQAILCGLHKVKPVGNKEWEKGICHELILKCKGPLCAMVCSVNEEENSALISLTNTDGEEDLHINDWLLLKEYAALGRFTAKKNRNFTFMHYLKSLEHKGYDTKNITKNTQEPLLNGSFKFSDSEYSFKETKPSPRAMERIPKSVENASKDNSDLEKTTANSQKIPSLLNLKFIQQESLKSKIQTSKLNVEENKSKTEVSCPKVLKRTLALISKTQEKRNAENSLDTFSSSVTSSKSSENVDTSESLNSMITNSSKSKSRLEMLLKFTKSSTSTPLELKSKKNECKVQNEEKIAEKSPVTEEILENKSTSPSSSSSEINEDYIPLHLREEEKVEQLPEFGTLRSEFGGRGRMQHVDWHQIRQDIKKTEIQQTCQFRSNEKALNLIKSLEKEINDSKKSCQKEDVPKLVDTRQKICSHLQRELSRFNKYNTINSNFADKEFNFTTLTNVKSSTTPISPLLKLRQRLHANSFQSDSKLINFKLAKIITGKTDENNEPIKIINESKKLTKTEEILKKLKMDKVEQNKVEVIIEKEKNEQNQSKLTDLEVNQKIEISIKDKERKINLQPVKKSESLDSDDFSDELSEVESDKISISTSSESTIHEKLIKEESSSEEELTHTEEIINKKETEPIVKENLYVFNDMDLTSDSEIWDGLSFSGEIAPVKFTKQKSVSSSRVSSPTRSVTNFDESFDSNIMNFQYNELMSRKKQEENEKKMIESKAIERNSSSNSSANSSVTENNLSESAKEMTAIKNFKPTGRQGSLMRMLANIQKEPQHI